MAQRILSRFKNTNDPPSDLEALQVWGVLDEARDKLGSIEARISRHQDRHGSETLRRDSASLHRTIQLCRSILSPSRRIPTEILAHIFRYTTPSIEDARRMQWDQSLQSSPWILGHISRRWRAIALGSPTLWNFIIIKNMNDDSDPCSLPMLENQLHRSAGSSLDIVIDYEYYDGDPFVMEKALEALAKCSSRWRSFYITGQQLMRLPRIRGRVPLLEKLCVWGIDEQEEDSGNSPPPDHLDHFQIAPRLRDLEVEECFPYFKVPWGQLARYTAGGPWEAHISALSLLRTVEFCSFMMAHEHDLEDRVSRTFEMPKLRQLELYMERYDSGEYWTCPAWLVAPALTDLSIASSMIRGLARFLQVSKCTLRKLHLTWRSPDPDLIRPVFQASPGITELSIALVDRFPSFTTVPLLSILTVQPNAPLLLPNLQTIIIHCSSSHGDIIGDMVNSRWKTRSLRSVYISSEAPLATNLTSKLERLQKEGLKVIIHRPEHKTLERNYGDADQTFGYDWVN